MLLANRMNFLDGFGMLNNFFDEPIFQSNFGLKIDVQETDDSVILKADLPGISKEELSIVVENGIIIISGERLKNKEEQNNGCCISERSFGKFSRNFKLKGVDESSVEAVLKDGVLTVSIKKLANSAPKKVLIN